MVSMELIVSLVASIAGTALLGHLLKRVPRRSRHLYLSVVGAGLVTYLLAHVTVFHTKGTPAPVLLTVPILTCIIIAIALAEEPPHSA